jgi:hypothetical protein
LKTIPFRVRFVRIADLANSNSIQCDILIQARQEDLPMSDQFWLTKAQLGMVRASLPVLWSAFNSAMPKVKQQLLAAPETRLAVATVA